MKTQVKNRRFWAAAIMIVLLAVDRASKLFMEQWLADKGLIEIIPGFLGLRLLDGGNTGAAWGILSGNTILLVVFTLIILAVILYILFVKQLRSHWLRVAVIFIAAGGLGNLYDRIVYGAVTDFFEFLFIEFPVFNVADCCVTGGAVVAIAWLLFSKNNTALFLEGKPDHKADTETTETERFPDKTDVCDETGDA